MDGRLSPFQVYGGLIQEHGSLMQTAQVRHLRAGSVELVWHGYCRAHVEKASAGYCPCYRGQRLRTSNEICS